MSVSYHPRCFALVYNQLASSLATASSPASASGLALTSCAISYTHFKANTFKFGLEAQPNPELNYDATPFGSKSTFFS